VRGMGRCGEHGWPAARPGGGRGPSPHPRGWSLAQADQLAQRKLYKRVIREVRS